MPSHKSEIDDYVRKFNETKSHDWETLTIDGTPDQYCKHCGRKKQDCAMKH